MAITFQTQGAAAFSAAAGSTVAPAYPASIAANNLLVLIVGQKSSSANGGTVTTPAGWSLITSLTAAGGYGATLGADTGDTNIFAYSKVAVGSESGTLSVTVGTNDVCWAQMLRFSNGTGSWSVAGTTGQQSVTPSSPLSITFSANPGIDPKDYVVTAMCVPTDIGAGATFSSEAVTATGVTFGATTEISEPFSANGNDIGAVLFYNSVTAGPASAAPVFTSTLAGTLTNIRGPAAFIRVRETVAATQTITAGGTATTPLASFLSLVEDFSSSTKWALSAAATVSGATLNLPLNSGYTGYAVTNGHYDLTGSSIFLQFLQAPSPGAGTSRYVFADMYKTGLGSFGFDWSEGTLGAWKNVTGVGVTYLATASYNATTHQWLKVSESGGTVTWAISPNGSSWTTFATGSLGFACTDLQLEIGSGCAAGDATPGTAKFDNINTGVDTADATHTTTAAGTVAAALTRAADSTQTVTAAGTATITSPRTADSTQAVTSASSATITLTRTIDSTQTATAAGTATITLTRAADVTQAATAASTTAAVLVAVANSTQTVTASGTATALLTRTADSTAAITASGTAAITLTRTADCTQAVTASQSAYAAVPVATGASVTTGGATASAAITATTSGTGTATAGGSSAATVTLVAAGTGSTTAGATAAIGTAPASGTSTTTVGATASALLQATSSGTSTVTASHASTVALTRTISGTSSSTSSSTADVTVTELAAASASVAAAGTGTVAKTFTGAADGPSVATAVATVSVIRIASGTAVATTQTAADTTLTRAVTGLQATAATSTADASIVAVEVVPGRMQARAVPAASASATSQGTGRMNAAGTTPAQNVSAISQGVPVMSVRSAQPCSISAIPSP